MNSRVLLPALAGILVIASPALAQTTSVLHGGDVASSVVSWIAVALAAPVAALLSAAAYKALGWLGVQTTQGQRDQLQSIILNGINTASAKAQAQLKNNPDLDVNIKNQIVSDAISYAQSHAKETLTALGLDPNSGQAVQVLRDRVMATIADPSQPTAPIADVAVGVPQSTAAAAIKKDGAP